MSRGPTFGCPSSSGIQDDEGATYAVLRKELFALVAIFLKRLQAKVGTVALGTGGAGNINILINNVKATWIGRDWSRKERSKLTLPVITEFLPCLGTRDNETTFGESLHIKRKIELCFKRWP